MENSSVVEERISQTIRLARVLCIYFMMLVHVPPGFDSYAQACKQNPNAFFVMQTFLTGVMGRSSVPLLSIISGYLAVASLARYGFGKFTKSRFRTLYVPIIFWNALLLLFGFTAFSMLGIKTSAYEAVAQFSPFQLIYGAILTVDYSGITVALRFLRDLFVCGLLLPLMLWPARRAPVLSLVVVLMVSAMGWLAPVVYRPSILQFFYLGVVLHYNRQLVPAIPRYTVLFYAALVAVSALFFLQFFGVIHQRAFFIGGIDVFSTVKQFVAAGAMWCFCFWLARLPAAKLVARFEVATFPTYLAHVFVLGVAWFSWQRLIGSQPGSAAYALFFVGTPLALLFAVRAAEPWLARLPAGLQIPLKGKVTRIPAQRERRRPSRPSAAVIAHQPQLTPPKR